MRGGEIADVDVIAHAGAVGRGVIGAEHGDAVALARGRFHRDFDEVGGAGRALARAALAISASDVEVAQRAVVQRVGDRDVGQQP